MENHNIPPEQIGYPRTMTSLRSMAARLPFPSSARWLLPVVLVLLFLAILIWLPWQARQMESNERQEQLIADTLWVEQTIRFQLGRHEEDLKSVANEILAGASVKRLHDRMASELKTGLELKRVMWITPEGDVAASSDEAPPAVAMVSTPSRAAAARARLSRNGV